MKIRLEDVVMWALVVIALLATYNALADAPVNPKQETRYCYALADIPRDADGSIHRDSSVIIAFYKAHPCPFTQKTTGACPGWEINHIIPLASGGCDAVWNMQWLPVEIKRCSGSLCVDRFERLIYAPDFGKH